MNIAEKGIHIWAETNKVLLDPDHYASDAVVLSLEPNEAREMAKRLFEQSLAPDEARQVSKDLLIASCEAKQRANGVG